jgi:hypothetical protein
MGNHKDTAKFRGDRIDGREQAVATFPILTAETFINN